MRRSGGSGLATAVAAALWLGSPAQAAFVTLTGTITDSAGVGIAGVQIDFVDSCTGLAAAATGNITSTTGTFRATVNAGVYDVEIVPPALPSVYTAYRIRSFDLTVSRVLPAPIALPHGIVASGRVTDAGGAGISGAYVHFFPPGSSERVFTVRDTTDLSGNFGVVVSDGTYDVKFGAPRGSHSLGLVERSVPIPASTVLPTVTLGTGLLVTGTVFNSSGAGQPVVNVNLDAINAFTGEKVFLSHDRTDAAGAYSIVLPPGTYSLDFKPERCALLVAQESAPIVVTSDVAMPRVTLAPGVLVKGQVTDTRGTAVFDVNTNYIGSSGVQAFTFDDHTDAAGFYSAVVPPDVYNIEYAPPVGVRLAGVKAYGVAISKSVTLSTVQLPDGVAVSGRTRNVDGAPLGGIDLDFFDLSVTGAPKIYTPHDLTATDGRFAVVVVPGAYDIRFEPPSSAPLAAKRLKNVAVGADLPLGDVVILRGYVVTGHVSDAGGAPVVNVDLDFYDANTHEKIETLHDNTDTLGDYSVTVPARLYNVYFTAPAGVPLETGRLAGVSITSSTSGLDIVLGGAVLVSGRVRDALSNPVAGADLDFSRSGSGLAQPLSRDKTAADGTFGVYVPQGTYDIVFTPPAALGLGAARMSGVPVAADLNLQDIVLARAIIPALTSIAPAAGPSDGGTAVSILGSGFEEGLAVTLGGLKLLDVRLISAGQITAVTPGFPSGASGTLADLAVTNVGTTTVVLSRAFSLLAAPVQARVTATRVPPNVVLSWSSTGQGFYTIYRSAAPSRFGEAEVLVILDSTATSFTDVGADADGVNYFYRVE